jgi:hypothetical protein
VSALEIAALAVAALLACGAALRVALRHIAEEQAQLPIHWQLERRGFRRGRAEAAVGADDLARAVQACAACRDQDACRAWISGWGSGTRAPRCPNAAFFQRL